MDVYTNPSILAEAVLPAMAMEPKELTEDWIKTLEIEKIAPCNPAGRPIFAMSISLSFVIFSLSFRSRYGASERTRHWTISAAETHWEMTVARATPATPIENAITKIRFSTTLMIPAVKRKYSGLLVSPTALRTALPKL